MDNGSDERKNLKFTEVEKLSQFLKTDYNELIYGESGFSRYAMNFILKKYAGLDDDFRLRALFEHGVIYTEDINNSCRVHEYLPSIVASQFRVDVLKKQPNFKGAYAIGPYIHYADSLLNNDQLKEEKERLGKTLLVFPSHSIDGVVQKFDYNNFINEIKETASDYDTVRVCVYYKDVDLKNHVPYQKEGFEVITAGHHNDHYFLPRLKSIILNSDMAMSNDIGSQLGYCIYLNKPYYLTSIDEVSFEGEDDSAMSKYHMLNVKKSMNEFHKSPNVVNIKHLFSNYDPSISKEQFELISYLWGFNCVKTKNELKNIFLELDDNYSVFRYYISQFIRLNDLIKDKYLGLGKL